MAKLDLQLDEELVDELEKLAAARGLSLESFIVESIRENLLSHAISRAIAQSSTIESARGYMLSTH